MALCKVFFGNWDSGLKKGCQKKTMEKGITRLNEKLHPQSNDNDGRYAAVSSLALGKHVDHELARRSFLAQ